VRTVPCTLPVDCPRPLDHGATTVVSRTWTTEQSAGETPTLLWSDLTCGCLIEAHVYDLVLARGQRPKFIPR
jgi:hypothetical protein